MTDKRIETLAQLKQLSLDRKSVVCPGLKCFRKPCPAAFAMNYSGILLLRLFNSGLYIYKKEKV